MTLFDASYVALWLMMVAIGALALALLRHVGMLELRVEELSRPRVSHIQRDGLSPGTVAPHLTLLDDGGREVVFAPPLGRGALVVLSQPGCGPCDQLVPHLERLVAAEGAPDVTVITKGPPGSGAAPRGVRVLYQRRSEAMTGFRAFATPWAFVIGPDGRIVAQSIVNDLAGLRRLLAGDGAAHITASLKEDIG